MLAAQARPLDDGYREDSQLDADIFGSLWTAAHVSCHFCPLAFGNGSAACSFSRKLLKLRLHLDLLLKFQDSLCLAALCSFCFISFFPAFCPRADSGSLLAQSRRNLVASPRALHDGAKALSEADAVAADCAADETAAVSSCNLHACLRQLLLCALV